MFNPIYQFKNCLKLESQILDLERNGRIPISIIQGHKTYHYALVHKLKSAKHNLDRLETVLKRNPSEILLASSDFMFAVNLSIDGYFYSCGSALDILAREVLTYFGEPLPTLVYFNTARDKLTQNRPLDTIILKLQEPSWKLEFSNYRNALTHEIIIASSFSINVQSSADAQETTIILPLPDDPRIEPSVRTYERNPDVLKYVKDNLRRIISLVNKIYGEIFERARTTGSFPL
jgi:hypothetical protein